MRAAVPSQVRARMAADNISLVGIRQRGETTPRGEVRTGTRKGGTNARPNGEHGLPAAPAGRGRWRRWVWDISRKLDSEPERKRWFATHHTNHLAVESYGVGFPVGQPRQLQHCLNLQHLSLPSSTGRASHSTGLRHVAWRLSLRLPSVTSGSGPRKRRKRDAQIDRVGWRGLPARWRDGGRADPAPARNSVEKGGSGRGGGGPIPLPERRAQRRGVLRLLAPCQPRSRLETSPELNRRLTAR